MIRTVGTGVFINQNQNILTNITTVFNTLSNNVLTKLLPLISADLLVYVGNIPISYSQKLG